MAVSRIRRRPESTQAGDPEARVAALMEAHGASLLRTARHFSLCADDAHDAMQRALEIYLRKLDEVDPGSEGSYMKVVVRHEALAVRRLRSESVANEDVDFETREDDGLRPLEERLSTSERSARSAEALRRLKPDEARGLMLKAEGLSYAEIGERAGWTYTNVMASIAVFIALGGTSYAALSRNSVGPAQIRSKAVGSSELKNRSVTSSKIRPRSVTASRLSASARETLRGVQGPVGATGPVGPAGPSGLTYRAGVNAGGGPVAGNATDRTGKEGAGVYRVAFDRSMAGCVFTATLARVPGGVTVDPPPGRITAAEDNGQILVRTFDVDATPRDLPFNVLAAC